MNTPILALLLVLAPAGAALATSPMTPFTAEYQTLRNGKELARTTLRLSDNGDSTWTLLTTTQGTSGLAKMAGLDVSEESILRWADGRPESIRYDFRQDVAFKSKQRHAEFDRDLQQVHMIDGKSDSRYPLLPYSIDRHALTLALAADLSRGASQFDYKVATRDELEDVRYTRCGEQVEITVPAGTFSTDCVERVREKRTSRSWFSAAQEWLPVQIEQIEKKGDTVTLRLLTIRRP